MPDQDRRSWQRVEEALSRFQQVGQLKVPGARRDVRSKVGGVTFVKGPGWSVTSVTASLVKIDPLPPAFGILEHAVDEDDDWFHVIESPPTSRSVLMISPPTGTTGDRPTGSTQSGERGELLFQGQDRLMEISVLPDPFDDLSRRETEWTLAFGRSGDFLPRHGSRNGVANESGVDPTDTASRIGQDSEIIGQYPDQTRPTFIPVIA